MDSGTLDRMRKPHVRTSGFGEARAKAQRPRGERQIHGRIMGGAAIVFGRCRRALSRRRAHPRCAAESRARGEGVSTRASRSRPETLIA